MAINLTDASVRTASTDKRRGIEITDAKCQGLTLRIGPSGVKTWTFKYRDKSTGRVERLSIGRYPDVTLARAREFADRRRIEVAEGRNPRAAQRRQRTEERAAITFHDLVERYLSDRVAELTPKSFDVVRAYLTPARKAWADHRAKDVTRDAVVALLRERAHVAPVAANRLRSILATMFTWAVDEGLVPATPVIRIAKPATEKARNRVVLNDEFPVLWREFERLDPALQRVLQTLALLGQRPGEIADLEVGELLDLGDPRNARIELPPERTKNKRLHVVPLPARARRLIIDAIAAKPEEDTSPFVFASPRNHGSPIDRHSVSRAMVRLIEGLATTGDAAHDAAVKRLQADRATPHDFRRTLITGLGRLGFRREDVKALVNHAEGDVTERHYDRYDRLPEKRRMLEAWEAHILTLIGELPAAAGVVRMQRRQRK